MPRRPDPPPSASGSATSTLSITIITSSSATATFGATATLHRDMGKRTANAELLENALETPLGVHQWIQRAFSTVGLFVSAKPMFCQAFQTGLSVLCVCSEVFSKSLDRRKYMSAWFGWLTRLDFHSQNFLGDPGKTFLITRFPEKFLRIDVEKPL